jgi:hypothetical protein
MLVSIGAYDICNGTLAGGVAISDLRPSNNRLFDIVVPLDDSDVTLFDRINTTCDLTLTVKRTHASVANAEQFIVQLDTALPTSGNVTFTTTGPTPTTRTIPNGFIVDHTLLQQQGATTFHSYHIVGGPPVAT